MPPPDLRHVVIVAFPGCSRSTPSDRSRCSRPPRGWPTAPGVRGRLPRHAGIGGRRTGAQRERAGGRHRCRSTDLAADDRSTRCVLPGGDGVHAGPPRRRTDRLGARHGPLVPPPGHRVHRHVPRRRGRPARRPHRHHPLGTGARGWPHEFPALTVDPDPIYVHDGRVWTSAGVTAGIDLSLAMVRGRPRHRGRPDRGPLAGDVPPPARWPDPVRRAGVGAAGRTVHRARRAGVGRSGPRRRPSAAGAGRRGGHERAPLQPRVHRRGRRDHPAATSSVCASRPPAATWRPPTTRSTSSPPAAASARPRPCAARSSAASASPPTRTAGASAPSPEPHSILTVLTHPERTHHAGRHPPLPPVHRARRHRPVRGAAAHPVHRRHVHRPRARRGPQRERASSASPSTARSRTSPTPTSSCSPAASAPGRCSTTSGSSTGCAPRTRPRRSPRRCAPVRSCSAPPACSTASPPPPTGRATPNCEATGATPVGRPRGRAPRPAHHHRRRREQRHRHGAAPDRDPGRHDRRQGRAADDRVRPAAPVRQRQRGQGERRRRCRRRGRPVIDTPNSASDAGGLAVTQNLSSA